MPGFSVPVVNEREVRGAAGILFALGLVAYVNALVLRDPDLLKPFGVLFMVDMLLRLGIGERWSPTLWLARVVVRRQSPDWVGAPQKEFAWWLGLGIAMAACMGMGLLNLPTLVVFILCGFCVTILFLETAFGLCMGCVLHRRFSRDQTMYCASDACAR